MRNPSQPQSASWRTAETSTRRGPARWRASLARRAQRALPFGHEPFDTLRAVSGGKPRLPYEPLRAEWSREDEGGCAFAVKYRSLFGCASAARTPIFCKSISKAQASRHFNSPPAQFPEIRNLRSHTRLTLARPLTVHYPLETYRVSKDNGPIKTARIGYAAVARRSPATAGRRRVLARRSSGGSERRRAVILLCQTRGVEWLERRPTLA